MRAESTKSQISSCLFLSFLFLCTFRLGQTILVNWRFKGSFSTPFTPLFLPLFTSLLLFFLPPLFIRNHGREMNISST
ncbi:hypothetical protein F5H01DRAFT_329801 [Linnemannia elongata]|nr:hypothetical protein F5H01DRAFT_329801 [Linnemannia elongata]